MFKMMKKIYLTSLLILLIYITSACTQQVQSAQPKCRDVQVPYAESRCAQKLEINQIEWESVDKLSYDAKECPNLQSGITNYGNFRLGWELVNKNDVLLSVPCKIIIKKYDWSSGNYIEEKILDTATVNIPAQSKETLTKNVYLPKCWTYMGIDCKDIKELDECQSVTKYRSETKCD